LPSPGALVAGADVLRDADPEFVTAVQGVGKLAEWSREGAGHPGHGAGAAGADEVTELDIVAGVHLEAVRDRVEILEDNRSQFAADLRWGHRRDRCQFGVLAGNDVHPAQAANR
jgi:hypothetical protein